MASEAFGDVDVASLTLEGHSLRRDIRESIVAAILRRTIDGAPTLHIDMADPHAELLQSGVFSKRITMQLAGYSFELAQIKKNGTRLNLVLEEITVAALRRVDTPRKIAPGAMTRSQFIQELVREAGPWIKISAAASPEPTKSELARGTPADPMTGAIEDREDTWKATGRLADDVGWRRFIRGPQEFVLMPETTMVSTPPMYRFHEDSPGIIRIDFDWDTGKQTATCQIECFASLWEAGPGTHVSLERLGPIDGDKWLVNNIERSLFSKKANITLNHARPTLPEPESGVGELTGMDGEIQLPEGYETSPGPSNVSPEGYQWPAKGYLTSGFGPRGGRFHYGIDIGVGVGSPIMAAKEGVVTFQGEKGGYGWTVEITHPDGNWTRYAHLSQFLIARGANVVRGQIIGLSGGKPGARGAGNSRGPHLHFEVRLKSGSAIDPEKVLVRGLRRVPRARVV